MGQQSINIANVRSVATDRPKTTRHVWRHAQRNLIRQEYFPATEWKWCCRMAALPGKAGWVGMALYRLVRMRGKTTITIRSQELAEQLGINRKSVSNSLSTLEHERIITAKRARGSFAQVELIFLPASKSQPSSKQ